MSWELDNYEVLNLQGKVKNDDLPKEGRIVELRATLSYEKIKEMYFSLCKNIATETDRYGKTDIKFKRRGR